jgi:hypothetical protein
VNRRNYLPSDRWLVVDNGHTPKVVQQYHGIVHMTNDNFTIDELRKFGWKITLLRKVGIRPRRKKIAS